MKKNLGINLLLISIGITTIGSIFKVMRLLAFSEILLGIGIVLFMLAVTIMVTKIFSKKTA